MNRACECGLEYVAGHPADETYHSHWHDEYENGARIALLPFIPSTGKVALLPLIVADSSMPAPLRHALAHAALVAQRSMPNYKTGYDGTNPDAVQLFLLAKEDRAIALALTGTERFFWLLEWSPNGRLALKQDGQVDPGAEKPTVARVWVAKAYRRRGLASALLAAVANYFHAQVAELGWELPLTADGAGLLRRVLSSSWLGSGDLDALRRTLESDTLLGSCS